VERDNESGYQEGNKVTDRSVRPEQFGSFLIEIFNRMIKRDVGQTFVLNFDGALAGWLGMAGTDMHPGPTCGLGMALGIMAILLLRSFRGASHLLATS